MDYTLLSAEEILRRYHKELKNVRMMRWLTLAVFLFLLWRFAEKINVMTAVLAVVVFLLANQFLQSLQVQQFALLQQVLNQKCDAVKYTEIMHTLAEKPGKDGVTIRLCLAKGQYFAGRFAEARETLDSVYSEKPSVGTAMLYHNLDFSCRLEERDLEGAKNARQETEKLLGAVKPKQQGTLRQQLRMMDAALALEEDRYEDFFQLQKQVLQEAVAPIQTVSAMYRLALGELVQGENESAFDHLKQVVEQGGTLYIAADAQNLLDEYALPESE